MTPLPDRRPVVVGVSPFSDHARVVRWAATEAVRRDTGLRLVHAYPVLPSVGMWPLDQAIPPDEAQRAHAEEVVGRAARRISWEYPNLLVDAVIAEGAVEDVLRVESQHAAVLVVGGDEHGPVAEAVLNSVAGALLREAACPVVGVPPVAGAAEADGPVVVGVDGTASSRGAVVFAFERAARTGVSVQLVHCWNAPRERQARTMERESRLLVLAESVAGLAADYPEVPVVESLREGHPLDELAAASQRAGLLVVGTRGRGRLTSAVLGSTSRTLVRCASCPVAVVRSDYAGHRGATTARG